jgi:glycosyltransferase involved in cell wall biosynthesis
VAIVAGPRCYDGHGDAATQRAQRDEAIAIARRALSEMPSSRYKPDFWFSYHVYYKSPDWLGPLMSRELGIPYVIAEGSHAPKRAGGPWAIGHEQTTAALSSAALLFAMTAFDRYCLDQIAPGRVRDLKPFADLSGLPAPKIHEGTPRLVTLAMMRNERKRDSYALLAAALKHVSRRVSLTIIGNGPYRAEIERMFGELSDRHDVRFAGAVPPDEVAATLAASGEIFAWPGLGEAYGLVFLEAQALGLPVVACSDRGVPDVVKQGETGLLSTPGDARAYAANIERLLDEHALRSELGRAAHRFVATERSVAAAAATLAKAFAEIVK